MKIVSEKKLSPTVVLEELSKQEELTPRQEDALEYLRKHTAVQDEETVNELKAELEGLDKFNDAQVLKIIELLPTTEQEVRSLFSKERIKLEDEDIDAVISFSRSVSEN